MSMLQYRSPVTAAAPGSSLTTSAGGMEQVRVLIVDDDEDDYLIARDLLSEIDGASFSVQWMYDPAAALTALAENRFDICLLDYRLGRYNGLEVLREAMARGVTSPIILLTGQEDTDVDREAVRIGASDYLVKGRINSVLIDRAIRYARQQRQTQEALREQTEFVSAVLDTAGALVVVLDLQGRIVRFNRQCEVTTGYASADVLGKIYWEFLLRPEQRAHAEEVFASLPSGGKLRSHESVWLTRTGEERLIAFSHTTLPGRDGSLAYVVSTGIDVTEQRKAEEALAAAREREVEVGASIQKTLLIRNPPAGLGGLDFGARSRASQKIGGDYFDFFVFDESTVDVLVGDVMGKGVPAALLAAATKNHFQRCVRRLGFALAPHTRRPEPDEIVNAVHACLTGELVGLNSFVTLAYARFDLTRRVMKFVDCGHPHPLRISEDGESCEPLSGENMPLGMNERERYRQFETPLKAGDVLFFYSDGLTEAVSAEDPDDLFGEERLIEVLCAAVGRGLSASEIADEAVRAVSEFSGDGDERQGDDLTCVAIRVNEWAVARRDAFATLEIPSDPDALESVREFVCDFCGRAKDARLDEDTVDLLALAVNEGVSNAMQHAYSGRRDGRIEIEAETLRDAENRLTELRFRLYDSGEAFQNRDAVAEPSFDGSRDSGFGLFIMEQCFDKVEYRRDELGRNCTTLVKNWVGLAGGGGNDLFALNVPEESCD